MKSILFSFWQVFSKLPIHQAVPDLFRAARGILRAIFCRSSPDLTRLRNAHCEPCPFFDSRWKTCGTPGDIAGASKRKIGCWCYLPLANRDPEKDCWARAHDLDVGWPDVLRPKEEDA